MDAASEEERDSVSVRNCNVGMPEMSKQSQAHIVHKPAGLAGQKVA